MASLTHKIYNLCQSKDTVSSELASNPSFAPGHAVTKLYGSDDKTCQVDHSREPVSQEDLQRAFECGKWGNTRPSKQFLHIYHDILCVLNDDNLAGVCSPPLMGSSGVVPLSIISTISDNVRHMSNLIARAEREVFLATNFWAAGDTTGLITDALRELSRRMGTHGRKAIVKIMYDRGSIKQIIDHHQIVPPSVYTGSAIQIPGPEEIPNVELEVLNYHRPMLGTFHAKYIVVDRKIAVVCSCNIQDNDNFEMSCHLEGPIVDSIYDMALISWHRELNPPLPSHASPAALGGLHTFEQDPQFKKRAYIPGIEGTPSSPDPPLSTNATVLPSDPGNKHTGDVSGDRLPSGERLPEHTARDPHYDPDIASEVARVQSVVSPSGNETRMEAVTRHLNSTTHLDIKGDAPECPPGEEMIPYMPHPVHEPFPIAMCNRKPHGAPGNFDVYVPQNTAWLSAIRTAEKSVFIQTPDMNSPQVIEALLAAARRGVIVTCYLCLGYNDAGELLPLQGGTNEMISHKMYTDLEPEYRKNLRIAFYVGKDMTKPINNKFKKRSCHIKLMIVDNRIGIQGSGNQDAQSWYHSQEVNIMLESKVVCEAWEDALRRNQNTHIYGWVSQEDGIWRDAEGKEAEGSIGVDPGRFSWAKGVVGAIDRVRGVGGF